MFFFLLFKRFPPSFSHSDPPSPRPWYTSTWSRGNVVNRSFKTFLSINKSQISLKCLGVQVRKSMSLPMPLVPPFKPNTIITSIVLVIHTETSLTPSKPLLGPLDHVLLVLGPLFEQEEDGGEGWWSWLSYNAL